MSVFSERHYFFPFVSVHEGMTCGLVCRKVLRNSLFESQGESQVRTKPEGSRSTTHIFALLALSSNNSKYSSEKISLDIFRKLRYVVT